MSQIRRRKGNRRLAKHPFPIVIFVYSNRIEGTVNDESEHGYGVIAPANSGLRENQTVRILVNRERKMAKVVHVHTSDTEDNIGLRII